MPALHLGIVRGTTAAGDDMLDAQAFEPQREWAGKSVLYRAAHQEGLAIRLHLARQRAPARKAGAQKASDIF